MFGVGVGISILFSPSCLVCLLFYYYYYLLDLLDGIWEESMSDVSFEVNHLAGGVISDNVRHMK